MYQGSRLPRRAFLGLELRARKREQNGDNHGEARGIEVVRVAPMGTAAAMGVAPGDRLLALDDLPMEEPKTLVQAISTREAGASIALTLLRDGVEKRVEGKLLPLPVEHLEGAQVCLSEIVVEGARLRTLLTIPSSAEPPFPVFLLLPGLGCASCELSLAPDDPDRRLLQGFSDRGFATMRVERSGVGDSEGRPCQTLSFFDELASYREALAVLSSDARFSSIFLFGKSVGGMMAPLLAPAQSPIRGVVVFGTSSLKWYDCIVSATRRQRTLAGMSGDELEHWVWGWSEIHRLVCREGQLPRDVFASRPDLTYWNGSACNGEQMYGRHVSFFQELERMDLPALWRTVAAPVLVLHGEYDWVCEPSEGKQIAEILADRASLSGGARYVELPRVGHDMRRHESLLQSYEAPRNGHVDDRLIVEIAEWLKGLPEGSAKVLGLEHEARAIEG